LYISPYNDERIVAGHGTVGLEILRDLPVVEAVVVPVGGGCLISGIGIAVKGLKPEACVVGAQSQASPVMFESIKTGKIVSAHRHHRYTIAEGLAGGLEKGSVTFGIVQRYVDEILLVSEEWISRSVYLVWENEKQVEEGSAAAAVAAVLDNVESFSGLSVALVVTGGNIDDSLFKSILASEQ
jgi:threonine dehydratase